MWELAVMLAMVGVSFILAYFAIRLEEKHIFLKLLFLFVTMFTFILSANTARAMVDNDTLSKTINISYTVILYLIILIFVYFFIYFIYEFFAEKKSRKEREYDSEY